MAEVDFVAKRDAQRASLPAGSVVPQGVDFVDKRQQASQVVQDVSDVLGDSFDPDNFAPAGLRFNLSRGDTLAEKRLRLKNEFPEGELSFTGRSIVTGEGPEKAQLKYRESPNDKWKLVNMPGFEAGDIVSALGPSAEAVIGESVFATAANLLGSGKLTVPKVVTIQALGAFLGEGAEQAMQSMNDVQLQSFVEQLKEGGVESGLSLGFGLATSPLVAGRNIATGRGILDISEQGVDALQAAGRLSDRIGENINLTPGSISQNPLVARQEMQAAVVIPAFKEAYTKIVSQLEKAVSSAAPPGRISQAIQSTVDGLRNFSNKFIDGLRIRKTSPTKGGEALQSGRADYDLVSKRITDDAFTAARGIQDPQFDFSIWRDATNDLRLGSRGPIKPEVERIIKDLEAIDGPITLSDGSTLSVTDQLRNVRTDARSLAEPPPGIIAGTKEGQAGAVVKTITDTLENAKNTDPAFKQAWAKANEAARIRHDALDAESVIKIAKSQEPSDLLAFAAPGNSRKLGIIRDVVGPKDWKVFKNAFYSDLADDLPTLSQRIRAFDDDTLKVLMPSQGERKQWFKVADELDRINAVGADKTAFEQVGNKEFVRKTIETANPNTFFTISRAINETNNQALRDTWRRGVIDWVWDDAIVPTKNSLEIKRGQVRSRMKQLEENGMLRFLSKETRKVLDDVDTVATSLERLADAGTSIRGMEIASGLPGEVVTLDFTGPAVKGFIQSYGIGHLYLSSPGRFILLGKGKPSSKGEFLRVFGAALGRIGANENLRQLEDEE